MRIPCVAIAMNDELTSAVLDFIVVNHAEPEKSADRFLPALAISILWPERQDHPPAGREFTDLVEHMLHIIDLLTQPAECLKVEPDRPCHVVARLAILVCFPEARTEFFKIEIGVEQCVGAVWIIFGKHHGTPSALLVPSCASCLLVEALE